MAISTYAELQTAIADWLARSDLSGDAVDFITLAEAHLNREIPAVETDVTLTGTLDSRRIDISANSVVSALALFLVDSSSGDEIEITRKADGTFPYLDTSGEPQFWAIDGTNIDFDRPLDAAYTFRFRIRQKYTLSASATTNWLLTNHPDVYLAASLLWGGVFKRGSFEMETYSALLKGAIPSIRTIIAEQNRALLTVDTALLTPAAYDWESDQ